MACGSGLDRVGALGRRHLDANRDFGRGSRNFLGVDPKAQRISIYVGFGGFPS